MTDETDTTQENAAPPPPLTPAALDGKKWSDLNDKERVDALRIECIRLGMGLVNQGNVIQAYLDALRALAVSIQTLQRAQYDMPIYLREK